MIGFSMPYNMPSTESRGSYTEQATRITFPSIKLEEVGGVLAVVVLLSGFMS